MRHVAIACILALVAVILSYAPAVAARDVEYEEGYSRVEPLTADGKVYLGNISGDVRIQTWNRNEVKIDAMKRSTAGTTEKAKANADKVRIEVRREDGRLKIETKYPEGRIVLKKFNVSVDYTLTVPMKASVTANTISGSVHANGLAGLAKLTSVSGDVNAQNMKNGGVFTTVSGSIDLKDITGDVEAGTVSGSISLCCLTGSVKAETVSGDITATKMAGSKSVSISVHSGELEFVGGVSPGGRYTFETHSGPISVTLPADAAFDFECESFSGHIESDFKIASETSGKARHRTMTYSAMRGTANGGGADLTISTFSGPIELRKSD